MAKVIMIQGTMSNVGKSALAAGLCRVLKQDGYKVAPFKSQNMALNSFITQNGLEMGRAQVMQAEAAGIEPEVSMNPILLKPTNDTGSQVIINGKPIGVMSAVEYYRHKRDYIPYILEAYRELEKKYDVIVINFANPDMVGHTGVQAAAIKAVEAVDECVGKAVEALKEVDGQMFICADHGNAEQLVNYETGEPLTSHTTNPVPFILVNADPSYTLKEDGCLADIIPTMIELMGMEQPAEMTGKSLLIKK